MNRPLHVLVVHERYAPDMGGGGEYILHEQCRELQARGHTLTVLVAGNPALTSHEGVATHRLPISRHRMVLARREVQAAAHGVDVIFANSFYALWPAWRAARALGKPLVLCFLGLFGDAWLDMRGPLVGRLFRLAENALLRLPAPARVFLSSASLEQARRLCRPQPGDCAINPGIDLHHYGARGAKDCVCFSGKFDVRKGIDTVLRVALALPHVPFRLVGWGDRLEAIRATAPANVTVVAYRNNVQLAEELERARVFLFPSKAETFGIVVVEAMAAGCAVVSTAPVPFEGVRLDADDFDAALGATRTFWDDPEACARVGQRNREAAQAFSWQRNVDQLERLFRQVMVDPRGAA